jgi:CRP-like cAMP-binding protein
MLFSAMERMEVAKGEVVIHEGAEGDFFYVVLKGAFDVFKVPVPHCVQNAATKNNA